MNLFELDPELLSSLKDFDWAVRVLASGEQQGRRQSRKVGTGMEFNQYRPYSQGDDLRQLDWKMYARSDKFYIKQSEVETHISVTFVLDLSGSMEYKEGQWSKLNVAKLLIAVLAYVSRQHGDQFGLADEFGNKAGNIERHWLRFLNRLQALEAGCTFQTPPIENKRGKELFVVLSDLYEENSEWLSFIKQLKSGRNEVIVFQLTGDQEEKLEWDETTLFKDLESGQTVEVNPAGIRKAYQERIGQWKERIEKEFLLSGIDYYPIRFNQPLGPMLQFFNQKRKRLL